MSSAFLFFRPLIHALPPEVAHNAAIWCLRHGLVPHRSMPADAILATSAFGLRFTNPIGLAAGFDKNAVAVDALLRQGFGFVEAGTATPLPQPGNPKPRLFRLREDEAVINRFGFNNHGIAPFAEQLRRRRKQLGITGANIGKNKASADAVADYLTALEAVYPHTDYVTVNISSPNTQGLRDLQERGALECLLSALLEKRVALQAAHGMRVPLLLKIAPDLELPAIHDIVQTALNLALDGLIVSNTTIVRPADLLSSHRQETGGLSGTPLFAPSTELLKTCYRLTQGRLPLIGVGGIGSAADAYAKIRAGATLVQLYTALVYQGFGLVHAMRRQLAVYLRQDGFGHISEAVGIDAQ